MTERVILNCKEEEDLANVLQSLDELKLTTLFPVDILGRGFTYYYENWITTLEIKGEHIKAVVEGSSSYQVQIQKQGGELKALCDCPYDGKCKHIAAVLIASMHQVQAK